MKQTKIQSVDRAVDILEQLAAAPQGLKLADLAESMQLKSPTVHHLLQTLLARGFVEKMSRPTRYGLGPAFVRMAATQSALAAQADIAAAMARLAGEFGNAVINFARLVGGEVLTVLRMSPDQPGVLQRPEHLVMSPYTSASGLAVLAFSPSEQSGSYADRYPFDEYASQHWLSLPRLEQFLQDARDDGVLVAPDDGRLLRMSAPCVGPSGDFMGVMGMSALVSGITDPQTTLSEMVEALRSSTSNF